MTDLVRITGEYYAPETGAGVNERVDAVEMDGPALTPTHTGQVRRFADFRGKRCSQVLLQAVVTHARSFALRTGCAQCVGCGEGVETHIASVRHCC